MIHLFNLGQNDKFIFAEWLLKSRVYSETSQSKHYKISYSFYFEFHIAAHISSMMWIITAVFSDINFIIFSPAMNSENNLTDSSIIYCKDVS